MKLVNAGPASVFALVALLISASPSLLGQTAPAPKRLSDWLLEQPESPDAYPLGLSWQVPEESVRQTAQLLELLEALSGSNREIKANPESVGRLRDLLRILPVTGRVPVPVPDARWLQANPARDPIIKAGHRVILPNRPRTVTVITSRGDRCTVAHMPGREVQGYLEACSPGAAQLTDIAWIAQPDGRVQRFGIAAWNRQTQDEPAPGAWIWGPPRDGGWPEQVSYQLISFLATQGPAADMPGTEAVPAGPTSIKSEIAPVLPARSRSAEVTKSDWGSVGLLQTPTARMEKTGHFSFSMSRAKPYTQANTFMQPFDWMEAGFRYTAVSNRLYGDAGFSGDQSYKDKSIDVKFRLWSESAYVPEFAIGLRDVAGTGLFSGEYLVANKRAGNFDWSLGLGWGYLGARGDVRNPLARLNKSFDSRKNDAGQGGNLAFGSYFRGPVAFFGGLQYQSPWERWILKMEYDGNDYQHEPLSNNQRRSSSLNFGLVYRASRWADLTVGLERGNTLMFSVALNTQLDGLETPKVSDPPRTPVQALRPSAAPDWTATSREIARQTEWHVRKIEQTDNELRVTFDDAEAVYLRDRTERAAAVLHRDAPASVDRFALVFRQRGLDVTEHVVERDAWVEQQTQLLPPSERRDSLISRSTPPESATAATVHYENEQRRFEAGLGFDYQQTLGGPDGFILFQISAVERVRYRLRNDTWVQGTLRLGLYGNYDKFKFAGFSNLPRVRTFLREYLTTSGLTLPNLQLQHVGKLSENQYYSLYGGYLEPMFAGVGGEWLYKRAGSRTAYGVDINSVRQRNFEQDFGLRDYSVVTGHAALYWDTGFEDVQAKLSVGRYLARDIGATLEISRVFRNGVTIGAFATKTNVSAEQFGEGSFDKGIYMSIPFDAILTRSTNTIGNFLWKPLTRDGGAMLARSNLLYGLTSARNERALWYQPAPRPNEAVIPADRREDWSPKPAGPEPFLHVVPKPASAAWTPGSSYEYRLVDALHRQGFRRIRVAYDASHRLTVDVAHETLRPISRAVGRAARTAIRLAPLEAREIRVSFAEQASTTVVYEFVDLAKLDRFFGGTLSASELAETVAVRYFESAATEKDPLAMLGDIDTREVSPTLREIVPGGRSIARVGGDLSAAASTASNVNWWRAGALGAGLVFASSTLDNRGLRFARDHADNRLLKGFNRMGDVLPWVGAGLVTLAALDGSDSRRSNTGFAALEAGGAAFLVSTGLKYLTGRARPDAGQGNHSYKAFSSQDSFPSRHAITAWAVATPFALEYDSNWRYAAASIVSLSRIGKGEHWVSDAVAGSLMGYAIGRVFWESSKAQRKGEPRVLLSPTGINVAWDFH